MPPRMPKRWSELEVHPETQRAWEELIDDLLALEMDPSESEHCALPIAAIGRGQGRVGDAL